MKNNQFVKMPRGGSPTDEAILATRERLWERMYKRFLEDKCTSKG